MEKRGKHGVLSGSETGFTLVEIAIVMVIIGLLIGGVLKGREMIKNAKITRVMKEADELRAAATSYQDRYGFLPGDDRDARTHTGNRRLPNGNGNGYIEWREAPYFFMHLAAAGFISGSYTTSTASFPRNPFGGWYAVYRTRINRKTTHWIRTTNIPSDVGRIIDNKYDDGVYNTGSVRANRNYNNNAPVDLYIEF